MRTEPKKWDTSAEQALLSSVMIDPAAMDLVSQNVNGSHFFDASMGQMFDALVLLKEMGKRINDPVVLSAELPKLLRECKLTMADYVRMINALPNAAHARYYADIVRRLADLRTLDSMAAKLLDHTNRTDANPTEISELLIMELGNLGLATDEPSQDFADVAKAAVVDLLREKRKGTARGVYMGLAELDGPNGPLLPSELLVIAARPGQGKTALGLQMTMHNSNHDRPSLFVSLEMKDRELALRYLCKAAGIDSLSIRNGSASEADLRELSQAADDCKFPLRVYAPHKATFQQIKAAVRHAKIAYGIELVCIDYIGRIRPSRDQRHLQRNDLLGEYIEGCKTLAKELDIAVVALAQLNRKAGEEVPQMHHLAESGAIEREADMILLLHHPEVEGRPPEVRSAQIIVAKQRHGRTGSITVGWKPKATEFVSRVEAMAERNYNPSFGDYNNS